MKDRLIKLLGGYTEADMALVQEASQQNAKTQYDLGYKDGLEKGEKKARSGITRSYGWLKSEIHRKLDIMFPGKEFGRARYRWLRRNTQRNVHISQMSYEELVETNKHLDETLGGDV